MPEEPHEVQKVALVQWTYKNITFWRKLMQYTITGLSLDYQSNVDSRQKKFIVKTMLLKGQVHS